MATIGRTVTSKADPFGNTGSVTRVIAGERWSYVALGLVWPLVVAVVFFVVGWDDPPPSLALLVYAGLQVWVIQLVVTVPAFAVDNARKVTLLWGCCRL